MTSFPLDALEFSNRFGTDEQCEATLEKMRWPKVLSARIADTMMGID